MTQIDAEAVRRALADPADVCARLGLRGRRQPTGLVVRCPAPGHDDRNPSCSVTRGPDGTVRVRCFACGFAGDVLTLIAAVRGLDARHDFARVVAEAADLGHVVPETPEPAPEPSRMPSEVFDAIVAPLAHLGALAAGSRVARDVEVYLGRRGLLAAARREGWWALPPAPFARTSALMLREAAAGAHLVGREHRPGFSEGDLAACGLFAGDALRHAEHRLVIPWRDPKGRTDTIQRRRLDGRTPKYVFPTGRRPRWPYGVERLRDGVPVVLVEGAIDVLALRWLDAGTGVDRDVLGIPGGTSWDRRWDGLLAGRKVWMGTDDDAAGDRAAETWCEVALAGGASEVLRLRPAEGKDWAEILQARRSA